MPAAAVIPAPIMYANIAAVEKFVVSMKIHPVGELWFSLDLSITKLIF